MGWQSAKGNSNLLPKGNRGDRGFKDFKGFKDPKDLKKKKDGCGAFTPNRRYRLLRDFCAKTSISNQKTQSVQQMQGGTRKPPPQFTDVNEEVVYRSATQQLLCNMRFMRGFP
jgi:hypothetical protein